MDLDAGVEVALLVDRHSVVVAKCVKEVVSVAFDDVFDAKIVHDEREDNWPPLVSPEAGGDEALVVAVLEEAFFEELLGEAS